MPCCYLSLHPFDGTPLQIIWADGGYAGALVAWVKGLRPFGKLHLDIVRRSDDAKGFQLVRKRWIVERTFCWLYKSRRLSRDYEQRPDPSESDIYVCMSRLMLKRLAKKQLNRLSGCALRQREQEKQTSPTGIARNEPENVAVLS